MRARRPDFRAVRATPEEVQAYRDQSKRRGGSTSVPGVPRAECVYCGTRIWYSGLGIGSHKKACPGWDGEQWVLGKDGKYERAEVAANR